MGTIEDLNEDPVQPLSEEAVQHPANASSAIIDLLKQDAEDVSNPQDVYIPINGWERTGLAARYRLGKGKELEQIAIKVDRKFSDRSDKNLYTGIDTMILLCTGLFIKSDEAVTEENPDGWVELDPNNTGSALTYSDDGLAAIFGWENEVQTARELVRKLFGKNDLATNDHAARLSRWLVNTKSKVNAALWSTEGE